MNIAADFKVLRAGRARAPVPAPPGEQDVARRKVFYIAGFDPSGARRYRALYRREGHRQAAIAGYSLDLRGQMVTAGANPGWRARYREGPVKAVTDIEFLGWDDLVRRSICSSLFYVYLLMLRTLWIYLASGAVGAMWRLRPAPLIAGLVPAAVMIFYLAFACLAGLATALVVTGPMGWHVVLGAVVGLGVTTLAMLATRVFEEQLMIYFMVNDLGYTACAAGDYPDPLNCRLDEFATRIRAALTSRNYDEVLVVGHSSGAQLAVSALARALRGGEVSGVPRVGLMTLGQSIAMMSFLPRADALRADLAQLADDAGIFWLDVTAPGDGASFALSDPSASCRAEGRPAAAPNPVVISAAFRRTMDPGDLRQLRWRWLRMHFQYLCAFSSPVDFDYFAITSGPRSLASRFAGRRCSPAMRTEPVAPICHRG